MYGDEDRRSRRFEWDGRKAAANLRKHGVRFADAASAFDDNRAITETERVNGEHRVVLLGRDELGRLLVVVWTERGDRIRVISARKANPRERAAYGKPR